MKGVKDDKDLQLLWKQKLQRNACAVYLQI